MTTLTSIQGKHIVELSTTEYHQVQKLLEKQPKSLSSDEAAKTEIKAAIIKYHNRKFKQNGKQETTRATARS